MDPKIDPTGPAPTGYGVLRGGSYQNAQKSVETCFRFPTPPDAAGLDRGFRCVSTD